MIQGTGSDVGKSLIVAGLCRLAADRGLRVRPFKPQNMSNNAAVTDDGGEIGRAQALQARAARVPPSRHMNPVLLKPESETGAQLVVQGRMRGHAAARDYTARKPALRRAVLESFRQLCAEADLVLVEGAGSPAEINLRDHDIANMGFAEAADCPVALVGDIERGGVIASLVGTHALLTPGERDRVSGFLVNKFRGDPGLFAGGAAAVVQRTGWPCLGILPWFAEADRLPAEDALALARPAAGDECEARVRIAVPVLSRIANFDDLDPLRLEPGVSVAMVRPGRALPGDADLVILAGSKSTIGELRFLREQGWDIDLRAHRRRGGRVLGLCGGYQMLGRRVSDPCGIEGPPGTAEGLGLLDVKTVLTADKTVGGVRGIDRTSGLPVEGYEIHVGVTTGPDTGRAMLSLAGPDGRMRPDGAVSADGRTAGCYVHGLFAADGFRRDYMRRLGDAGDGLDGFDAAVEAALDALASHLAQDGIADRLLALAR